LEKRRGTGVIMSRNDITGDLIKTKSPNDLYDAGWDLIFKKNEKLDELVAESQSMGMYETQINPMIRNSMKQEEK
jgi:hypothetical protein